MDEPLGPRDLPLAWSRLPLLPRRLKPRGWKLALGTWRTATTAYAKGDLRVASERFLTVAEQLSGPQRGAARRVRITGRCLAYENAGRALVAARDDAGARALLKAAAEKDPDCQNSIALRISRIAREAPATVETASTSAP
ncbi:MAG: hypothetical protein AAFU79_28350 [Myxococcota bacterium]